MECANLGLFVKTADKNTFGVRLQVAWPVFSQACQGHRNNKNKSCRQVRAGGKRDVTTENGVGFKIKF